MSTRPRDVIAVETTRGVFRRFQALAITNDITSQTEATFMLGDDGSASDFYDTIKPGELFTVTLNGRPRLSGRAEVNRIAGSAEGGFQVQLIVRTKMSDAFYCSADPGVSVENTTIKDFVLGQYKKLGYAESDFVFSIGASVDLMTGLAKGERGTRIDLAPMKTDQAKASPTESVRNCVERHLKRFHAAHWDGPDGKIYVGRPADDADPLYNFRVRRGPAAQGNNVGTCERGIDWSQVPSELWVYGQTTGKDVASATVKGKSADEDLLAVFKANGHFYRPVILQNDQAKDLAQAEAIARRERSARSRDKDTWSLTVDGWSHWTSGGAIPYAPNTTADVDIISGPVGRYLCVSTQLMLSPDQVIGTKLALIKKGIWVI